MLLTEKCDAAAAELAYAVGNTIEHSHSIEHLCLVIDAMFVLADTTLLLESASSYSVLNVNEDANRYVIMALLYQIKEHAFDSEKAINRLALLARFNPRLNEAIDSSYNYHIQRNNEAQIPFVDKSMKQLYERLMS